MNPKLIPILERIIARDVILQSLQPDNLPQSALAYIRHTYVMCRSLSWEEHDLIEMLPALSDNRSESIRDAGGIGNPDSSVYHLFDDGSLWLKTNAYSSVWADATDYAIEILLPRMTLSRMDAQLLRAIDMGDAVESVRADFYSSFAQVLHRDCGIPYCDSREHWNAYSRQLGDGAREELELGGSYAGRSEGFRFASEYTITA
tara:strand:- start:5 stop:613 length:609 start_codon:yes stop_codon:yes gene_type:complete